MNKVKFTINDMLNDDGYQSFIADRLGNDLFINDTERAKRIYKASEWGGDGSTHFEVIDDFAVFQKNAKRVQKDLGVQYPILYGGPAKKAVAATVFPMLNHIMSYPTAIFIVHTEYPRFILNLENDEVEWLEDFTSEDEKALSEEAENLIEAATEFYDREIARYED